MSSETNTVGGRKSSALDPEEKDFEQVVKNALSKKFDEWPNEAGFEGLTEVRGPVQLKTLGSIPSWAIGTLYRTGPGGYNIENTPRGTVRTTHWFDGFAHTHKFEIKADPHDPMGPVRVEYGSRYQSQQYVDNIRKTGRVQGLSFGQRQDPCIGIFGKVMSVFKRDEPNPVPNSRNICVTVHPNMPGLTSNSNQKSAGHRGGRTLYLTTDASLIKEISPETLEPIGIARQRMLHPLLKGPLSSAHAHRDPETGDLFNFNLDMGRYATYRVFRTNASNGTTDILATICSTDVKPAYIHSFFMSPSFVILCVPSTHIGYLGISVPWNGNIIDALEPFDKSKLCKWFVVDRRGNGGLVATFETTAGFFFHSINSFEEHDESTGDIDVYCDTVEYPSTSIIRSFEMDVLLHTNGTEETCWGDEQRIRDCLSRLVRHKFRVPCTRPGKTSRIQSEKIIEIKAPHVGELPTINPDYATRKYRYVYSLANNGYTTLHDTIVKTDLDALQTLSWSCKGHTPGESIFVPRPRQLKEGDEGVDGDEDDGVLLNVVLDGYGKASYLLCLDAKTMKELGRAECDWAVGHGFHGLHIR